MNAVAFVDILTENKLFVTLTFLKYVNKSEKIGNFPKKIKIHLISLSTEFQILQNEIKC